MFIELFEIGSLRIEEFGATTNHRPLVLFCTIADTLAKSAKSGIAFLRNFVSTVACSRLPSSNPEIPTLWDRKAVPGGIDEVQRKYLVFPYPHSPT